MLIEEKIKEKLVAYFIPVFINIINQSKLHHGKVGSETHFKIEIVSEKFKGKKRLERHRLVQNVLKDEFNLIKAFSLQAYTKEEWISKNKDFEKSPICRGQDE